MKAENVRAGGAFSELMAWKEGFAAYYNGLERHDNPYRAMGGVFVGGVFHPCKSLNDLRLPAGTITDHFAWTLGFNASKEEHESSD